jgi:hypothetical protein
VIDSGFNRSFALRNSDPLIWPSDDVDLSIKQQINRNYSDCINILQTIWYQADVDQRFSMADQDIWGLIFPGVATYKRKIFNFNIINPIIQAITGHQRSTRKSSIVIPILKESQKTADQLTKALYYVHNQSGAYQVYSDCFEQGALVQGLGFVSIYRDLTDDPISGDIKFRYIDMKSCLFDAYMRKHDMSDARFFETRQFFDRDEAARMYPRFADKILSLPRGTYRDDKFYYMPEVYQIQFPNLVAFDEYWYLSTRDCEFLIDTETEETQEWNGDEEDARIITRQFKGRLKIIKSTKKTVRRTVLVNDRVLVDEPDPNGIDRYPVVPMFGYCTPDTPYYAYKYRGVVRDMRDSQYLLNRLKVSNLDILDAQQQGLKIKQGALVTPEDSLNQGHGRALFVKKEYSLDDVQPMPIVPPSPIMIQMEEQLMQITHRIAGVDPSAMGVDVDDKAGIISMMRQVATARNLQRLFDQFDEAQRLISDIACKMMMHYWTFGKFKQVLGEEPTAEFDNKAFFKYGCKVVQGVLTESQQQLELAQLLEAKQILGDMMPNEEILEAMTLQNKDRIIQKIMANQQAAQEQQQKMAELQMQQLQIDNQTKLSYAHSQEGLAAERVAKIQTDKAVAEDKLKRAHEQDTHALLNLVKIAKELKGLDIDHLSKQVELLKMIQPEEKTVENTAEVSNG